MTSSITFCRMRPRRKKGSNKVANAADLASLATTHLEPWIFYAASFLTIPLAFGVLLDKNIIRAGFLLIGVFGGISALFLILQAQFLAMAQLMIYAVGITLVVVIALMLTNPRLEYETSIDLPQQRMPAITTCCFVFLVLYLCILSEGWSSTSQATAEDALTILGKNLLTWYALPFEFASVLLLVALIGAVMLAKADHFSPDDISNDALTTSDLERNEDVVEVK